MALRFVGNQCIRSAPTMRTNGASTLSFSMWMRINPGSGRSRNNTSFLFDHGEFRAINVYIPSDTTGFVMLEARVNEAGRTHISTIQGLNTPAGENFHLAFVMKDNIHRWYVNGSLASEAVQGGLSGTTDQDPRPFSVGLNGTGEDGAIDVTLDDPTVWEGYALSAEDILALRNRIAHP